MISATFALTPEPAPGERARCNCGGVTPPAIWSRAQARSSRSYARRHRSLQNRCGRPPHLPTPPSRTPATPLARSIKRVIELTNPDQFDIKLLKSHKGRHCQDQTLRSTPRSFDWSTPIPALRISAPTNLRIAEPWRGQSTRPRNQPSTRKPELGTGLRHPRARDEQPH